MSGLHFPYAVIAGIVPSLIWLFFWTREDKDQPEPRSLLTGCFIGGVFAVLLAIPLEQLAVGFAGSASIKYSLWAIIEEVLKFAAVAAIALRSKSFDEPIDAMIYCITVALGFAAVENTLFILGPFSQGNIFGGFITGNMRFMGATLVHVVSSTLIGFSVGLAFYKGYVLKVLYTLFGVAAAIVLHAAFNISIVDASPTDTLKTFSWIWLAVVIMIILFEEIKAVKPKDSEVIPH